MLWNPICSGNNGGCENPLPAPMLNPFLSWIVWKAKMGLCGLPKLPPPRGWWHLEVEVVVGPRCVVVGRNLVVVLGNDVGLNWVVVVLEGWRGVVEDGVENGRGFSVLIWSFNSCGEDGCSLEEISGCRVTLGLSSSSGRRCAWNVGKGSAGWWNKLPFG